MTTPSNDDSGARVNLGKDDQAPPPEPAFDPYRFGKPDHPVPPEFAPPGYVPDQAAGPPPPGVYPNSPYGQPYGQQPPPYGSPYGQPYPPPPPGRPGAVGGNNGKAVTAMVLGIVSIILCWLSFLAVFVIIPAVVFGILGLNDSKSRGGTGRSMAIAGIVCAVIGAILATVLTVFILRAADRCGGIENSNDPGFEQCIQDNFLSSR